MIQSGRRAWACAAIAWLTGCSASPAPLLERAEDAPSWPAPPDQPRLVYLASFREAADLRPTRSFWDRVGRTLFGGEDARSFVAPRAVCTAPGDRVFIADTGVHAIHVLDLARREYAVWPAEDSERQLDFPVDLAFDEAGDRLIVADAAAACLFLLDRAGRIVARIGESELQRPAGVAVHPQTRSIYVADAAAHQIVVFGTDGQVRTRIGGRGASPGRFNFPTALAFDSGGTLYVSDSLNFRVQAVTPETGAIRQIGSLGDVPGYFSRPRGVALDSEHHLYVVDANFEVVQIFDAEGRLLLSFGGEGAGPGQFWLPAGIHIDGKDRIWLADTYNRRVQVFQYLAEQAGEETMR